MHRFLHAAETGHGPRVVSIQNAYNLINRTFEIGLAEMAMREDVGLLAYSPLAQGYLTGKYGPGRDLEKAAYWLGTAVEQDKATASGAPVDPRLETPELSLARLELGVVEPLLGSRFLASGEQLCQALGDARMAPGTP